MPVSARIGLFCDLIAEKRESYSHCGSCGYLITLFILIILKMQTNLILYSWCFSVNQVKRVLRVKREISLYIFVPKLKFME